MNAFIVLDSIPAKFVKAIDSCSTCAHETNTNWADVNIAWIVCLSIIVSVFICVVGLLIWKIKVMCDNDQKEQQKKKTEIFEKYFKQRSDLLDKKLSFLKDISDKGNKDKLDETNAETYIVELKNDISEIDNKLNGIIK